MESQKFRPLEISLLAALCVVTIGEGRVTASADRVRINVSLVNATTGNQYADVELERPRAELFDLPSKSMGIARRRGARSATC